MSDVNANIDININSSNALAQLKSLQRQISQFHTSIAKSSETAALAQRGLQKNLLNSVNAISGFTAEMRTVTTSAESFTNSLEKNKFSMREYFRYAGASTKTFGRLFKSEFDTIGKVSEERVKRLQTQYIKMGRDTNGAMQAMAVMPTKLNLDDYSTKVQLTAQRQALFNQLMKQGSTNLLNFGKNTQWAGRQLMVGFTLPLMLVGSTATKTFMEMEAQAIKFKKVYGDLFTPKEETQEALDNITELGKAFTKYGVAVSTTVGLAAEAAAAGFSGLDLQRQTTEATRLSILGQIDSQKALETTISLQNAFGMSSEKLASSIDFLNAVENQTVVSLDDITTAIPKVAPVIQQLGGDVKDLTFFMAAMKEGGINASEGANALKSGLAALINPTGRASEMLKGFGINANEIVTKNKGDLKATVIEFAEALNALDPLNRAQAIEQMFGKFQFARLSTLFANVAKDGNQAARVLDLANSSVIELSALSEQELGMTADSAMNKFKKSVEDLKIALVPVGKAFLEAATPIIEFVGNILEKFANLSDGTKKVITLLTVGIGAVGPVLLMTFGLLANGVANIIKLFLTLRGGYQRLTGQSQILGEQTQYMTMEQIDAAAAAHSLNQTHAKLTQTFTAEANSIQKLIAAYSSATAASVNFARSNPGMMMPGRIGKKFAQGGMISGPGGPTSDSVPIMASNGEAIISAKTVKKYPGIIEGLISGNIPGFKKTGVVGKTSTQGTLNIGSKAVQMQALNDKNLSSMQNIINNILSGASGLKDAEGVLSETLIRLSSDTKASAAKFVKELDIVAGEMERIQIPESIVGERDYSASGSGISQNVPTQLSTTRGAAGIEEYRRAQVAAQATEKAYKDMGISGQQLAQSIQVDRAHIVEVTQAEKRYREAWDTRLFVAQARAENEMSMLLMNEKNQKAYVKVLENSGESEEMKRSILHKITKDIALTEDELQVQVRILESMQKDTNLMKTTTGQFSRVAVGTIAAGKARASMGPAGAGVGLRTASETEMAKQQLIKTKFRGDTEFVKRLEGQGTAAVDNLIVAMEKRAQTRSPSKRTIKLGKDIGRGLEIGMESRVDDVARSGEQLGNAAVGGTEKGRRSATRPQGPPRSVGISDPALLTMAYQENTMRDKLKRQAATTQVMNQRMDKLNRGFMAGTFALSSLSGVASMAGGNLGKFSQIIFQLTGPLFALSSIIQLLTGNKIMGYILKFRKVLGPVALGITALTIAGKFYLSAKEKERQQTEAFTNVLKSTAKEAQFLADKFNIIRKKGIGESFSVGAPNQIVASPTRAKMNAYKEDAAFQETYKDTISGVKNLSLKKAEAALTLKGLQLISEGVAKEEVQIIIDTIKEQAGKQELLLDFSAISFEGEGLQNVGKQLSASFAGFGKDFEKEFLEVQDFMESFRTNIPMEELIPEMSDEQLQKLKDAGAAVSSYSDSIFKLAADGGMNLEQFNTAFSVLFDSIKKKVPQSNAQIALLKSALTTLSPELGEAAAGVENFGQLQLILQAASAGVSGTLISQAASTYVSAAAIEVAAAAAKEAGQSTDDYRDSLLGLEAARRAVAAADTNIEAEIARILEVTKKINDAQKKAFEDLNNSGKENPLAKRTKEIENQTKAYKILRKENIDNATATDLSNDSEIAAIIIANNKGKKLTNLIARVKEYKAALEAQTAAAKANMSEEEGMTRILALADLRDRLIDFQFAGQLKTENDALKNQEKQLQGINDQINNITRAEIDPRQAQIAANNFALEGIARKEDIINEKYEKQISALEKIETLNQDIANVQKQRMSIADALTRGDVSAAVEAMQNARAQQAESALSRQKEGLTAGRDAAVGALGRNALEQRNKDLQYEISVIENTKLLSLQNQKTTIEGKIEATQRNITKINEEIETLKSATFHAGQTKDQLAAQKGLIEAADAAGLKYNGTLVKQLTTAKAINAAIETLNREVKTIHTIVTKNVSEGTPPTKPSATPPTKPQGKGLMYGGAITKYMAFGGRAVGSDTVPAMLTPGEFIVNKSAASKYGPMLKSLNESKYPSMLGQRSTPTVPIVSNSSSISDNSTAVYNYSLGFNINGSTSNSNDIARAVIKEIKNIDAQRIRGSRR
jgi:TP901 family phage tail tape measure protein